MYTYILYLNMYRYIHISYIGGLPEPVPLVIAVEVEELLPARQHMLVVLSGACDAL